MGRVLGIDYGRRRIGLAVSDPGRSIASPLAVYERRDHERDAQYFTTLVREEGVDRIVVGLPVHNRGGESTMSHEARNWSRWLESVCGCRVVLRDERFTSREAGERMREAGLSPRRHRDRIDMFAAQVLLQEYLDAGCTNQNSAALPLGDEAQELDGP
jgi:putative Holliday junction resolvase